MTAAEHDFDHLEETIGASAASADLASSNEEAERPRRRRGRRGGRRNRHDREGEPVSRQPDRFGSQPAHVSDHDLAPDFDEVMQQPPSEMPLVQVPSPPKEEPATHAASGSQSTDFAPVSSPDPNVAPMPASAEPPRRRSTVREPAFANARDETVESVAPPAQPAVMPEPAISTPEESTTSDRPRRSGWWSKRIFDRH